MKTQNNKLKDIFNFFSEKKLPNQDFNAASNYWSEEIANFKYIYSEYIPIIHENIIDHAYHITGDHSYKYRKHHKIDKRLKKKFEYFIKKFGDKYFISENLKKGDYGYNDGNYIFNIDTVKYFEIICFLKNYTNLFDELKKRKRLTEIGSGYGGFIKYLNCMNSSYNFQIIDLPEVMIFSLMYLSKFFDLSVKEIAIQSHSEKKLNYLSAHDYHDFKLNDICINVCSFQEMSKEQIENYIKKIKDDCLIFYSFNKEYNTNNNSIGNLKKFFYDKFDNSWEIKDFKFAFDQKGQIKRKIRKLIFNDSNLDYFHFYAQKKNINS